MDTTILEDKELAREFFAFLTRKVADANRRIDDLERKNGEKVRGSLFVKGDLLSRERFSLFFLISWAAFWARPLL